MLRDRGSIPRASKKGHLGKPPKCPFPLLLRNGRRRMDAMRKRRIKAGLCICVAILVMALIVAFVVHTSQPTPGVTPENFARLHRGMTEEEVIAVLGEAPERGSREEDPCTKHWSSKDFVESQGKQGCRIELTFTLWTWNPTYPDAPIRTFPASTPAWTNWAERHGQMRTEIGNLRIFSTNGQFNDVPLAELPSRPKPLLARIVEWFSPRPTTLPPFTRPLPPPTPLP
jgi:hypothetical protein